MSLVSNFASEISPLLFGNSIQNITNDVDINDQTFSNILNNKISGIEHTMNATGMNILDFQNNINNIPTENRIDNNPISDMTTSEILTFTKSLFDSSNLNSGHGAIYNFSRKNAADFYSKYSKNIAMNLEEFVEDTLKN